MLRLGFCITGSFCSMDDMLYVLEKVNKEYDLEIFISPNVNRINSRFYTKEDLINKIKSITSASIHTTIEEAEIYGPKEKLDLVLIYPCTSNTLAKLCHGINDNVVTMLVKSSLRNNVSIVLGVYTNDALGKSGKNIMTLLNTKNYYFVPLFQDDYIRKPLSMISDKDKVLDTLEFALKKEQYQPVILGYKSIE